MKAKCCMLRFARGARFLSRRPKFIIVLRYIDHSSYPSCRTGRPPLAERRPKFISVTAWSVRFRECPTSSTGFNLCENCYNPVYALAVGLMEIEK